MESVEEARSGEMNLCPFVSRVHCVRVCVSTYYCIGFEFVHKLTNDTILENGKPWSACVSKIGRKTSLVVRFSMIQTFI